MFQSSLVKIVILIICIISLINGKNLLNRRKYMTSTRKPVSIKICGTALVQMLDMVCHRARELLMHKQELSTHQKREMIIDDDPFTHTLSIKDYAQFNDTLIGDCCLQACTLKTLLKYC